MPGRRGSREGLQAAAVRQLDWRQGRAVRVPISSHLCESSASFHRRNSIGHEPERNSFPRPRESEARRADRSVCLDRFLDCLVGCGCVLRPSNSVSVLSARIFHGHLFECPIRAITTRMGYVRVAQVAASLAVC